MRKLIVSVVLLVSPFLVQSVFAQDDATHARIAAGCGSDDVKFGVKTDKKHHPMGQPQAGKALVYIFEDMEIDNEAQIGAITTRVGIDGTWVGANKTKSYFFFPSDPGEHRLCSSVQPVAAWRSHYAAATTFTAEPGQVYYFRTKTPAHVKSGQAVELVPVDPAEAQLLIAASAFSTSQAKK
jgi:hypothetical protein